jgi:hypothetical protein
MSKIVLNSMDGYQVTMFISSSSHVIVEPAGRYTRVILDPNHGGWVVVEPIDEVVTKIEAIYNPHFWR